MGKGDRRTRARKIVRGFVWKDPRERSCEEESKSRKGKEESLARLSMHRSTKPASASDAGFVIQSSAREAQATRAFSLSAP